MSKPRSFGTTPYFRPCRGSNNQVVRKAGRDERIKKFCIDFYSFTQRCQVVQDTFTKIFQGWDAEQITPGRLD